MAFKTVIANNFTTPVWRMAIDETQDMLLVEMRNTADKLVSFTGIDLNTCKSCFDDLILPERWLTGIEAAQDGILLLHGFQSEIMPVHKGLTGIDTTNGNVLWNDYNLTFERLGNNGTVVFDSRIQPKKMFVIDIRTGQRISAYDNSQQQISESYIKLPQILPAHQMPGHLLPVKPEGNVAHYLKHNDFEIVSLHALNRDNLIQYLYIWDDSHKLVFEDIINDGIQKLQPEAFMSYKNKLVWLKNRTILNVLNL